MTNAPQRREWPAWLTISIGTTALMVAMLLVMWAQQGPATCAASEAPRKLQLDRMVDREHLTADSAAAARRARRYMAAGTSADERLQRFVECDALLVREIAAAHSLSVEQVRASAAATE